MTKTIDPTLQQALDLHTRLGSNYKSADVMGIPESTFRRHVRRAIKLGIKPTVSKDATLEAQIRALRAELAGARRDELNEKKIRTGIIGIKESVEKLRPPEFILPPRNAVTSPGVPTLFVSDLHWGEKVDPDQINGVNEYDLSIAHKRMDMLVESAIHLLKILDPQMRYPGICMPLGGDMVTGNIHPELTATNEANIMPVFVDLFGKMVSTITFMADTLKRVFLPCSTGNHGRDTQKIWAKDRHATSFDWLLYTLLAKHFENDPRVTFYIPDGSDAFYRIYDHLYLLTHGDQFRGGDGIIGAIGPLIRGHQKKHSRNSQIDMAFDTMICGHWHQDIFLRRLIVNGSTKGYDEYAYQNNFAFEPPSQQLWVTHPKYHITYRMPVQVDRQRKPIKTNWVSVPE